MTIIIDAGRLERKRKNAIKSRTVHDRHRYFEGVAQARFVLRKVFRLIEEQAKLAGLDSLEHQALIQIYGSPQMKLRVKEVAEKLEGLPGIEWVISEHHSGGSMQERTLRRRYSWSRRP